MKKIFKNEYFKYILVILILCIILLYKLFINDRYFGHDTVFHVPNIITLSKTLSIFNIFGNNILKLPINEYGYGTYLFYPKIPHLLASYIYLFCKNAYLSMNLVYFITTFLSGVLMFFLAKKIFNSKIGALLSSIIYLTFPYHITEIYIRDAFAENFVFVAVPLVFLGLTYLKEDNYKKFYLYFITGYVLGMYSHLVSMVFGTFFVFLYLIYYYKDFLKKDKILALIKSAIIVTLLVLPFLVRLLEHKSLGIYTVFDNTIFGGRFWTTNNVLKLEDLYNQEARSDKIRVYIHFVVLILLFVTLIYHLVFRKKVNNNRDYIYLIGVIIILLVMLCWKDFWNIIPDFFSLIQFPWRLMTFLSIAISLYIPLIVNDNKKISYRGVNILLKCYVLLICIILIVSTVKNIEFYGNFEYTDNYVLSNNYSMGFQTEYLPKSLYMVFLYSINNGYEYKIRTYSECDIKILKDDFPNIKFKVSNLSDDTKITLPRIYYLGYKLEDSKGRKINIYNQNGYLGTNIDKDGTYNLVYTKTLLERIAIVLRFITIIYIVFIGIKFFKNSKLRTINNYK